MKRLMFTLCSLSAALAACGSDYPSENDIAAAWKIYQPDLASLYTPESMTNLRCSKAGNRAVYCEYKMGGIVHSDALNKTMDGHWEILMLSKENVSDD